MVETMAGGVVMFDYDGDGDEDLFFVDGAALPGYSGEAPRSRLYRNDGGRFVDATARAGIAVRTYGTGGAAADVDGDADLDLLVTGFVAEELWLNQGDGTFVNGTAGSGVSDPLWTAGAAFADVEGDGDLDLFLANYVDFRLDNHRFCGDAELGRQGYCSPEVYQGEPDRLLVNRGDGSFEDRTAAAGLVRTDAGAGLGVLFSDLDDDGHVDLYVANDLDPNNLYRNRGDGTFEDVSILSGTAYGDRGRPEAGMGVDSGDVDGDGRLDLVVTNFEWETNALYRNSGGLVFVDRRWPSGLAGPSLPMLAFGVALVDLDRDGDLDLTAANGHILDNAAEFDSRSHFGQRNQVFENVGGGRFEERKEAGLGAELPSRGLAAGDLDGDLDLDLVIVNSNERAEVYENVSPQGAGLALAFSGPGHGVGARVAATVPGLPRQVREVRAGGSYLSQSSLAVTLASGTASHVDVEVRFPRGLRRAYRGLPPGLRAVLAVPAP
jgi:hypothetical protein